MNTKFEKAPFEKDIQDFSREVREHQEKNKIESLKESHIKELLKSRLGQANTLQAQPKDQSGNTVIQQSDSLPDYLMKESDEIKNRVEGLINLAFLKGIDLSAKEAVKSGPFILDAFHDALTSKLYEELKKRGLLK